MARIYKQFPQPVHSTTHMCLEARAHWCKQPRRACFTQYSSDVTCKDCKAAAVEFVLLNDADDREVFSRGPSFGGSWDDDGPY